MVRFAFFRWDHVAFIRLSLLPNKHFLKRRCASKYLFTALTCGDALLKNMIRNIKMNKNRDKTFITKMFEKLQTAFTHAIGVAKDEMKIGMMNSIINDRIRDGMLYGIGSLFGP